MFKYKPSLIYYLLILVISINIKCSTVNNNKSETNKQNNKLDVSIRNKYAKGFTIKHFGTYTLLQIHNPWQNAKSISFNYYLSDNIDSLPDSLKGNVNFIKTPVTKVICLSTTHIGFISVLNALETIKAVANPKLIYNEQLCNQIKKGQTIDIGNENNLNYETVLRINPDVIFVYGVNAQNLSYVEKLNELGVEVVFIAEYLENNPLAKTEWIKFIAEFYNKSNIADSLMETISANYCKIKEIVDKEKYKPKILAGLPWKGTWYVPSGNSYLAQLIYDAGGNYLWHSDTSADVLPLDIEEVFYRAKDADIWINPGAANNAKNILSVDSRLAEFNVLKNGKVFNNNARININGGNDYWESGLMKPDIILKDLIQIFHPELLTNYQLYYYKPVEVN